MITTHNQLKWDIRFLLMAAHVASWSKDPSTTTGAIITKKKQLISAGYNGLPQGVEDTYERLNNRELKYSMINHCERNAIVLAQRDITGCTLYTWPFMSCSVCSGVVVQSGISRVVAPLNNNPRWVDSFKLSTEIFTEAGVEIVLVDPSKIPMLILNPPVEPEPVLLPT
jgi:dCMP deaminase